jgi:WD40 repeat protein
MVMASLLQRPPGTHDTLPFLVEHFDAGSPSATPLNQDRYASTAQMRSISTVPPPWRLSLLLMKRLGRTEIKCRPIAERLPAGLLDGLHHLGGLVGIAGERGRPALRRNRDAVGLPLSSRPTPMASSRTELRVLRGHTWFVTGCSITPDGELLVTAGDHTLKIWELPLACSRKMRR